MEMQSRFLTVGANEVPRFFYGTAWKEDQTVDLTLKALNAGFRAIDTANQRKHYCEIGVGEGIKKFLKSTSTKRESLFIQTKFTFARGQDHRKPYNENDSYTRQVSDSFTSSLKQLGVDYIDSYVLHGPFRSENIGDEDLETWAAMEKLLTDGKIRYLGISNVSPDQLRELCAKVKILPSFVQNRCYARQKWDMATRQICNERGIIYQGFSLLTANREEVNSSTVNDLAKKYGKTSQQIIFRFSQQLGMVTLTGTTNTENMRQDLDIYDFFLNADEVSQIEKVGV